VVLVLASSVTHAWWNLLAKRAGAGHAFFGVTAWLQVLLFAPAAVWLAWGYDWPARAPLYVLVGAALVGLNYLALTGAYQRLDLGVAYPIGRSSTLFLPLIAFPLLGESIDSTGWLALTLVTAGVLLVQHHPDTRWRLVDPKGVGWAVLAAVTLAGYTVWDKYVIRELAPLLYLYCYNTVIAAGYAPALVRAHGNGELKHVWRAHRWPAVQVAVLNTVTYALVLFALGLEKASYVGALRQTSLVIGMALGVWLLREPLTWLRVLGVALIVAGSAAATVAG